MRVPVSATHRLVYRDEIKKRENFFDLDSVDEVNECEGKAFSDITSLKYKPTRCSLLIEANLSTAASESVPSQRMFRQEERRPSSVHSAQVGRSSSRNLEMYKTPMSSANTVMGFSKITKEYSTDERSINTSLEIYWKSEGESDSLKCPRRLTASNDSLKEVFLGDRDVANKVMLSPQNTMDIDQTIHGNSDSPACSSHNRQQGGYNKHIYPEEKNGVSIRCSWTSASNHAFPQPAGVPLLIDENTLTSEIELLSRPTQRISDGLMEDDNHVGLIFKALCDEDILGKGWSDTDLAPGENEHVTLP